jgi:hypothetical protein
MKAGVEETAMHSLDLLIRGGIVVDPAQGLHAARDVSFRDGEVAAVSAPDANLGARRVVDARGKLVTPGLIDLHVHVFEGVSHYGIPPDDDLSGSTWCTEGWKAVAGHREGACGLLSAGAGLGRSVRGREARPDQRGHVRQWSGARRAPCHTGQRGRPRESLEKERSLCDPTYRSVSVPP